MKNYLKQIYLSLAAVLLISCGQSGTPNSNMLGKRTKVMQRLESSLKNNFLRYPILNQINRRNLNVKNFRVSTQTAAGNADTIYNNGNMQGRVNLLLDILNDDGTPYTLTDADRATAKLVQYQDPSLDLPDGWSFDHNENEFNHHIKGASKKYLKLKEVEIQKVPNDLNILSNLQIKDLPQTFPLWIKCKDKVENQKVAGYIILDGKVYTTHMNDPDHSFKSSVTISAIRSNIYSGDDIQLRQVHVGTEVPSEGIWEYDIYAVLMGLKDGTKFYYYEKYNHDQGLFYWTPWGPNDEHFYHLYSSFVMLYTIINGNKYDPMDYAKDGEFGGLIIDNHLKNGKTGSIKYPFADYQDIGFIEEYGNYLRIRISPNGDIHKERGGSTWKVN